MQPSNSRSEPGFEQGDHPRAVRPIYPNKWHDWYAVATVNPYQFATSGNVYFFLSESVPEKDWLFAPEKVGDGAIFKISNHECANDKQRAEAEGVDIAGRVPLTTALLRRGKDINNVEEIKEYLRRNLNWCCALVDNTGIPLEDVPSLQVKVSMYNETAEIVDRFEDFPVAHTPHLHPSITHGKLRGYSLDDD